MVTKPLFLQLRKFDADRDYEMICEWFKGHKRSFSDNTEAIPKDILPPLGWVVFNVDVENNEEEELAAVWLYLAMGAPVCFIEHVITKPGISAKTAKLALLHVATSCKATALSLGYALMVAHTIPVIARYMKNQGWFKAADDTVTMYTATNT